MSNNFDNGKQAKLHFDQSNFHYSIPQPIGLFQENNPIYRNISDICQPSHLFENKYETIHNDFSKLSVYSSTSNFGDENIFSDKDDISIMSYYVPPLVMEIPTKNEDNVPIYEGPLSPYTSFGTNEKGPIVLNALRPVLEEFVKIGLIDYKIFDYRVEGRCYYEGQIAAFILEIIATPTLKNPIHVELRRADGDVFIFDHFMSAFFEECKNKQLINQSDEKFKYCSQISFSKLMHPRQIDISKSLLTELLENIENMSDSTNFQIVKSSIATLSFHIKLNKLQELLAEVPNVIEIFTKVLDICEDVQIVHGILKILSTLLSSKKLNTPDNFQLVIRSIAKKWNKSKIEAHGNIKTTRIPSQQVVREAQKCLGILVS